MVQTRQVITKKEKNVKETKGIESKLRNKVLWKTNIGNVEMREILKTTNKQGGKETQKK